MSTGGECWGSGEVKKILGGGVEGVGRRRSGRASGGGWREEEEEGEEGGED